MCIHVRACIHNGISLTEKYLLGEDQNISLTLYRRMSLIRKSLLNSVHNAESQRHEHKPWT